MPTEGTARQTVRIDSDLWARFGDATERAEPPTDRSTALRDFVKWYLRERGAKLPKRTDRTVTPSEPTEPS